MARATGIEITETEIRAVELEGSDRKFRVLGATAVPLEPSEDGTISPEALGAAAKSALKGIRAKKEQVVLGLPAKDAVIREIVIPFTDREQIRKVIKFESESHLPSTNIDDVIVGFYPVAQQGPRTRIVIFAVEKAVIRKYLDALARVGIEPTQVDLGATALFSLTRLLPEIGVTDEDDTSVHVVLDVGHVTTTVIITEGPRLRMIRTIRLGAESLVRTLAHDLGIGRPEATRVTQTILKTDLPFASADTLESRNPTQALSATELRNDIIRDKEADFARRIVSEVRRTLSSIQVDGRVQNIWLTGPAGSSPALDRTLADAFHVPVRVLDTLGIGDTSRIDENCSHFLGPSLGLGLKALEHDPVRLEFRQEEFRFARKFERIRSPLLFAAALAFVLLAFLCILELKRVDVLEKDAEFLAAEGAREFESLVVDRARGDTTYLPYETPEDAEDVLRRLDKLKSQPESFLKGLIQETNRCASDIRARFGHPVGTDADNASAPESIARSAFDRMDAWSKVLNDLRKEKGVYLKIDKLRASERSVTWNWRVPRSQLQDTLDFLDNRMKALAGLRKQDGYSTGQLKPLGEEMEITNSELNWEIVN